MSTWLVPASDLTTEQIRAVEMEPTEHRVIMGGPGSGKTQVLLHRAAYLRDTHQVRPERFHIFVFTNALSDYIKSALNLLDIPQECVSTFDDWCMRYHKSEVSAKLPWDRVARRPDFKAMRLAVLNHIKATKPKPLWDFALVDEGQDLDTTRFEILKRLTRHMTVCMDHNQQIYDDGSSEADILACIGLKRRNIAFLETFRCCPYIVQVAAAYIDDRALRAAYIQQTKTAQTDIETPLLYRAANFDDEKGKLIEVIKLRINKGERIAVLLPMKRQVHGFALGLKEAGIDVEVQGNDLNFSTDRPKVMAYHSAKGLTFDTVIMPRLTPRSFPSLDDERVERLLFVGITRAVKWVYMSTSLLRPVDPLARLDPLIKAQKVTESIGSGEPEDAGTDSPDKADLMDFL